MIAAAIAVVGIVIALTLVPTPVDIPDLDDSVCAQINNMANEARFGRDYLDPRQPELILCR